MKQFIDLVKNVLSFFCKPFSKELSFFLYLLFLTSTVIFINRTYYENLQEGIFWFTVSGVMCYALCLPLSLFPNNKWYKRLLLILGVMSSLVDFFLTAVTNSIFYQYVTVILDTNLNEVLEFAQHFLNYKILFCFLLFLLFLRTIWFVFKRIAPNIYITFLCMSLVVIGLYSIRIRGAFVAKNIYICKIYAFAKTYIENSLNLKDHYVMQEIISANELSDNLLIIIGESFQKEFSSLYGYEKNTNPRLFQFVKDSSLYLYNQVVSPDVATTASLQKVLSTYCTNEKNKKWFECLPLPAILNKIGYNTYWISNQSKSGLWDGPIAKYANLCDSTLFVGTYKGINGDINYYDEVVLDALTKLKDGKSSPKCYFVHLMGSHYLYNSRYPKNRTHFTKSDYAKYPENQQETRAHYDNSILYNDSIISQIFDQFKDKETLGFYFSDHGQDIYVTDNNYAGHGRYGDAESEKIAKHIPFMIYTSSAFKEKYPKKMDLIKKNVENKFNTEHLIYTIMDILDARFKDDKSVQEYTLFKNR